MSIMATGGGAYKYYDQMKQVLGVEILREDEMDCLIMGMKGHVQGTKQGLKAVSMPRP